MPELWIVAREHCATQRAGAEESTNPAAQEKERKVILIKKKLLTSIRKYKAIRSKNPEKSN